MGVLYNTYNVSRIDLSGYTGANWLPAVVPYLDTSHMTNMQDMFLDWTYATIDVSGFDTSSVTNMNGLFHNCTAVTSLNLSNWDTSNVTDMNSLFNHCTSLEVLDLSNFNTSSVTVGFRYMFDGDASLTSIDFSNWDTSNVPDMYRMFRGCGKSTGMKIWVPSTFVATAVTNDGLKPFNNVPNATIQVFTNATSASAQGWGTINSNFVMHYNSTHQDFLNA